MGYPSFALRIEQPVLAEIAEERARQDTKWGEQNHPDGLNGTARLDFPGRWRLLADSARHDCDQSAAVGQLTWLEILREETYEAFAASEVTELRAELVQVAAVAVAWIEAIDRRAEKKGR